LKVERANSGESLKLVLKESEKNIYQREILAMKKKSQQIFTRA
jgi:hypothetical protein